MLVLIFAALIFFGLMVFGAVRLSVSLMFWCSKKPEDKHHVFKFYFPYYIIVFTSFCMSMIIIFGFEEIIILFFTSLYFLALVIWSYKMKQPEKVNHFENFAVEPNHPKSP